MSAGEISMPWRHNLVQVQSRGSVEAKGRRLVPVDPDSPAWVEFKPQDVVELDTQPGSDRTFVEVLDEHNAVIKQIDEFGRVHLIHADPDTFMALLTCLGFRLGSAPKDSVCDY